MRKFIIFFADGRKSQEVTLNGVMRYLEAALPSDEGIGIREV